MTLFRNRNIYNDDKKSPIRGFWSYWSKKSLFNYHVPANVCKNIFSNLHKKEKSKAGDTPGDFIRRSPRSAKIARCARCSNCDFRRSPRSAYKIADMWHVKYWRLDSPSVPVPAIFYAHRCESPAKSTNQVGRLYHMTFQNTPRWSPGTSLKCHIVVIGEKNRQVCPHQSVAKIACDFRWQSNSPRSAYKIARCVVVGFTAIPFILIPEYGQSNAT